MLLIRALTLCACAGLAGAATAPVLTYSTYLRDGFTPNAIAVDPAGNVYLAGRVVIDRGTQGSVGFVAKLNLQTGQYLYQSILNGQASQVVNAIALDAAGNAYVAGMDSSQGAQESFVAKLDANGDVLFSTPLGGAHASQALAIALTAGGQIVVSGISQGSSFPSTPGAYSVADTTNRPYLMELTPGGTSVIFSATGIGGNAIALDSSGDIYVAGTTNQVDYPTTPGAYQTTFPVINTCTFPCQISIPGQNQYVTKVDAKGATLIYSTALTGTSGTTNMGLAVDGAGDAYVTGYAGAGYPYTATAPPIVPLADYDVFGEFIAALPFVSKLDPAGAKLVFSVPMGGGGVQLDSAGEVYLGGGIGSQPLPGYAVTTSLPALAAVPSACLPNQLLITNSAYVAQVDGLSGDLLNTQFIGGDTLRISSVALGGSVLWVAGATYYPDVPFTPNAITVPVAGNTYAPGAYLGAVDFSQPQPPAGTQISCVLDGANLAVVGQAARLQLLSIFGSGLGPATGVAATDNSTTKLAGVEVDFGGTPAPLLYVSSNQINLAVPELASPLLTISPIQVTVAGAGSSIRALPIRGADASLFLNYSLSLPVSTTNSPEFFALAVNANGSINSPANPAPLGSTISVFVNGLIPDPGVIAGQLAFTASAGWTVSSFKQTTPYVYQVNVQVPSVLTAGAYSFSCQPAEAPMCTAGFTLFYSNEWPFWTAISSSLGDSAMVYVTQ